MKPAVSLHTFAATHPRWAVEAGVPNDTGWIRGVDFTRPTIDPFAALIDRIGERCRTSDRKTIAGWFTLTFGLSSWSAIAPGLLAGVVPDVSLTNVSFRFAPSLESVERIGIHQMRVVTDAAEDDAIRTALRAQLVTQAEPVAAALHAWSGLSLRAIWGLVAS